MSVTLDPTPDPLPPATLTKDQIWHRLNTDRMHAEAARTQAQAATARAEADRLAVLVDIAAKEWSNDPGWAPVKAAALAELARILPPVVPVPIPGGVAAAFHGLFVQPTYVGDGKVDPVTIIQNSSDPKAPGGATP